MEIGNRYVYRPINDIPHVEYLDGMNVMIKNIDENRPDFQYYVEDDLGIGTWASERELHSR